jgi:hypothetical protein
VGPTMGDSLGQWEVRDVVSSANGDLLYFEQRNYMMPTSCIGFYDRW